MFSVGTQHLNDPAALHAHRQSKTDRECISLLLSCFSDARLERAILESLPDIDSAPPPLLPPGWEQRLDQKSGVIFFVDHST